MVAFSSLDIDTCIKGISLFSRFARSPDQFEAPLNLIFFWFLGLYFNYQIDVLQATLHHRGLGDIVDLVNNARLDRT